MPIIDPMHRFVAAGVLQLIVIYWTYRRIALGDRTDPNLQQSTQTDTGSMSILLSGTMAVGLLVGLTGLLMLPEILGGSMFWPALLASQFSAHWVLEKHEREG